MRPKKNITLILRVLILSVFSFAFCQVSYGQGCVINAYNGFNRVFITPTAVGARTFQPGNGNNYVRWEGVCGTHTYVETTSLASGTCSVTESGVTRQGTYFPTVSLPFTRVCVPLDDHLYWVFLLIVPISYFYIRKRSLADEGLV